MIPRFSYLFHALLLLVSTAASPLRSRDSNSKVSSYWYEEITHDGISPFIADNATYQVYRNVKDFGAKGDGVNDDTAAIQAAINAQDRGPGGNGRGTTGAPASVYFPSGTYLVSSMIQMYVDTVLFGDPIDRPVIKAASHFSGDYLVNGYDPRLDPTINFYIVVKNFILDSTSVSSSSNLTLLDWGVSQACQLTNVEFNMPHGSQHTGVATTQGGSGTYMGNLDFIGGTIGVNMNNQQYSLKDITFTGTTTGILVSHGFTMTFQGMTFTDCQIGVNSSTGGFGNVGSVILLDSTATGVETVVLTKSQKTGNTTTVDDSIVIENLQVMNCASTVVAGTSVILTGPVSNTWVYGDAYLTPGSDIPTHDFGTTYRYSRSPVLSAGNYFTVSPPTYQTYDINKVVNIKTVEKYPVYGDGVHDDTANINKILSTYAGKALIFFPAGTYLVSSTIFVPDGSLLFGECWSAISATGSYFADASNPKPMVQVGNPGDIGVAQFSDMLFTVADILPGCILLEVNMAGANPGDVGSWNTHFRVGGALGSKVETGCQDGHNPCKAAFLLLHLTESASMYIEDMWGWTADHDLDLNYNQAISTGRGALIEATKGTWLVGTAFEHNTMYQYNLASAQNVFVAMQQSETPYWQGTGGPCQAPAPWTVDSSFADPTFDNCQANDPNCGMAWYELVNGGSELYIYGSGFWTFFNDLSTCQGVNGTCQDNAVDIEGSPSQLYWWNLNTRGVLNMVIDDNVDAVLGEDNLGSWGSVCAAILTHSSLSAVAKRFFPL